MSKQYEKTCAECRKQFISSWNNTKTCGFECNKLRQVKLTGRNVFAYKNLTSGTVGAIAEMEVATDLLSKGYAVFRALSPSCFCDLIGVKDNKILRFEVRTGYRSNTGRLAFPRNMHGEIDYFSVVERNTRKVFFLDTTLKEVELK